MARSRSVVLVLALLAGCAPSGGSALGSASWTLVTTSGTWAHDASASIVDTDTGERLVIGYTTQGDPAIADDEVSGWIYVDLDALPTAASELAIAGHVEYVHPGLAGVAQPPDERRWTFRPEPAAHPSVQRVLVYWGVFRPATSSYAGDVRGALVIESISASEVRGTLHLEVGTDAPGGGGTPFFSGPTTSDVDFVAAR